MSFGLMIGKKIAKLVSNIQIELFCKGKKEVELNLVHFWIGGYWKGYLMQLEDRTR
jgi:hypothetical protein